MSWRAGDLVNDDDLVAYEADVLTPARFGRVEWTDKRQKAIDDWLWPLLRQNHFPVERFRTRFAPDAVQTSTSSVFTDRLGASTSLTTDDLDLAAILASGSDALYIGSSQMFRGLSIRLSDSVSAVAATLSVSLWTDAWEPVAIADGTAKVDGKPFSGGGAITWRVPDGWVPRDVSGSKALYWAKVTCSAVPTGAKAGQIGVIRRSLLSGPAALRTLALIFREAPTQQDGPWQAKGEWYENEATAAWQRIQGALGGEFDTGVQDDQVSVPEAGQTAAQVTGGGWTLERG